MDEREGERKGEGKGTGTSKLAAVKRRQHCCPIRIGCDIEKIDRHLAVTDAMFHPVKMEALPTILQMFIDLNNGVPGLPASAAVKRRSSH
jgi:hypothetical protein